jgi:hypothetical protein
MVRCVIVPARKGLTVDVSGRLTLFSQFGRFLPECAGMRLARCSFTLVTTPSPRAISVSLSLLLVAALCLGGVVPAAAQTPDQAATQPPTAAQQARDETEQNVITVPTTEPIHRFGSHFRITHRFSRELGRGGFGDLAADMFGLDEGAVIGLDYRFAPTSNLQLGVYRSMLLRTIQFSTRYDAIRQSDTRPISISGLLAVEGINNFRDDHAPTIGVVVSRTHGRRLALYASPTFVWHSAAAPVSPLGNTQENTAYVGLGSRVMLPKTTYIALEITPRLTGFTPESSAWGIGIEKHTRGHLFQLNFTNSFGTTYGQVARGGTSGNVYLGFNIARKF